jgi:hypothetical protein
VNLVRLRRIRFGRSAPNLVADEARSNQTRSLNLPDALEARQRARDQNREQGRHRRGEQGEHHERDDLARHQLDAPRLRLDEDADQAGVL